MNSCQVSTSAHQTPEPIGTIPPVPVHHRKSPAESSSDIPCLSITINDDDDDNDNDDVQNSRPRHGHRQVTLPAVYRFRHGGAMEWFSQCAAVQMISFSTDVSL